MYDEFATVYDEFMDDFDYPAWADYYLALLGSRRCAGGEICEYPRACCAWPAIRRAAPV